MRAVLRVASLLTLFVYLAGCGAEAPTQLTLEVSSSGPLADTPTQIAISVKVEPPDGSLRTLYEGQSNFGFPAGINLTSTPLKVGWLLEKLAAFSTTK